MMYVHCVWTGIRTHCKQEVTNEIVEDKIMDVPESSMTCCINIEENNCH